MRFSPLAFLLASVGIGLTSANQSDQCVALSDTNVALASLGAIATQSSTGHGSPADRAIDGNTDPMWENGSMSHTADGDKRPWWQVQLKGSQTIGKVKVYNREGAPERMVGFILTIYDGEVEVYNSAVSASLESSTEKPVYTFAIPGVTGDRVRVTNPREMWLHLAEVEVFKACVHDCALSADELNALDCDFTNNLEPSIYCGKGGELVESCTECTTGGSMGCGGDCVFDGTIPICKDVDPSASIVDCGDHQATDCGTCDASSDDTSGCAGDCNWDPASDSCVDKDYVPDGDYVCEEERNTSWIRMPKSLKQVSVSNNGEHIWGVDSSDTIYYRNGKDGCGTYEGMWTTIAGSLKHVSVSADGEHVWGVNLHDHVYYRNGLAGQWIKIDGSLKQISVSGNGEHVWGVSDAGVAHYRNGKDAVGWLKASGTWKHLSVSANGEHVWGATVSDNVYYRNGLAGQWIEIDGSLKQISVSGNGEHIWGVNLHDHIYYRNGKDAAGWTGIGGSLKYVAVSDNGHRVWGANLHDYVYYKLA